MDEALFNKECSNYPGFVTKFRVSNNFSEANDHVGYENYRHVCHKWHYKITKALVFCLESKDYMQIRNSLIILMRILPHFPVLEKLSNIIERKAIKVRDEEKNKRQDLFVLASSYVGQLKARASQMIHEEEFHQVDPDKKSSNAAAAVKSEREPGEIKKESTTNSNSTKNEISKVPAPPKEVKLEKKLSRTPIKAPSPIPQVIEIIDNNKESRRNNNKDKDTEYREKSASPILVRESSVNSTNSKSSSRELKRAERRERESSRANAAIEDERKQQQQQQRDKDRGSSGRGSGRNKRISPEPLRGSYDYYKGSEDIAVIDQDRGGGGRGERMERELSSVSNSSNGSPVRIMDPPEPDPPMRESKRRKIEAPSSKKSSSSSASDKREKVQKTPKREKQQQQQQNDEAKELRREKRKNKEREIEPPVEKRLRRGNNDEDKLSHKNGGSGGRDHYRDLSPYERDDHDSREKYKSRNRSGY